MHVTRLAPRIGVSVCGKALWTHDPIYELLLLLLLLLLLSSLSLLLLLLFCFRNFPVIHRLAFVVFESTGRACEHYLYYIIIIIIIIYYYYIIIIK